MPPAMDLNKIAAAISPEDLSPEQLVTAFLVHRMKSLGKDALQDLTSLASTLAEGCSAETLCEVADTLQEIIFPEVLGNIVPSETETTERLTKHTQWVADRIKELRNKKNWTQEKLAQESGLPQSHISRLEKAQHSPSNKTLERIAKALGVGLSKLDPSEW